MLRHIVIAAPFAVTALAVPAWAADMEGKVHSVDAIERTVTLDNGTTLWLSDAVAVDSVKEGSVVKVVYEEKDGKPVALMIGIT